jgi:hypothetical protein
MLGVVVLFAFAIDQLRDAVARRLGSRLPRHLVVAVGVLVVFVPLFPPLPYSMHAVQVPQLFQTPLAAIPQGSVLLSYPFPGPLAAEPMLWQAEKGMHYRIVGGYAFVPDGRGGTTLSDDASVKQRLLTDVYTGQPVPTLTSSLRQAVLGDLQAWHVSTVVIVMSAPNATSVVGLFADVLGRAPRDDHGSAVWYQLPFGTGASTAPSA